MKILYTNSFQHKFTNLQYTILEHYMFFSFLCWGRICMYVCLCVCVCLCVQIFFHIKEKFDILSFYLTHISYLLFVPILTCVGKTLGKQETCEIRNSHTSYILVVLQFFIFRFLWVCVSEGIVIVSFSVLFSILDVIETVGVRWRRRHI